MYSYTVCSLGLSPSELENGLNFHLTARHFKSNNPKFLSFIDDGPYCNSCLSYDFFFCDFLSKNSKPHQYFRRENHFVSLSE